MEGGRGGVCEELMNVKWAYDRFSYKWNVIECKRGIIGKHNLYNGAKLCHFKCCGCLICLFMLSCQVVTPVPDIEYKENKRKTKSWKDVNFLRSELKVPRVRDTQHLYDILMKIISHISTSIDFQP